MQVFDKLYRAFDWGVLCILGGEPMLHKAALPVISRMGKKFFCRLYTNLSTQVLELSRLGLNAEGDIPYPFNKLRVGLSVSCSLHPSASGFNAEMFKGGALLLKSKGYLVSVTLVTYPAQLFLADEWAEWCGRAGIPFSLSPWNGADHRGNAANLTKDEREYAERFIYCRSLKLSDETLEARSTKDIDSAQWTQEQKELLGTIPRILSGELYMRAWSYAVSGIPAVLTYPRGLLSATLEGTVHNLPEIPVDWENPDSGFRIGGKLYPEFENRTLREFRAPLPSFLASGESASFALSLDLAELQPGPYRLEVDIVKENEFWMSEMGASPALYELVITA